MADAYTQDVRRVTPELAGKLAHGLRRMLRLGMCDETETWRLLTSFKFRDAVGCYWTIGPASQRWYRFQDGCWQPDQLPSRALEAPADLSAECELGTSGEFADLPPVPEPGFLEPEPPPEPGPAVLEEITRDCVAAYDSGRLGSAATTRALAEHCLIDRYGRAWMVGCRHGTWFCFDNGIWQAAARAPEIDTLTLHDGDRNATLGALDQAAQQRIGEFLEREAVLPEPVAAPWTPPTSFPELLPERSTTCENCGRATPICRTRCRHCGAATT